MIYQCLLLIASLVDWTKYSRYARIDSAVHEFNEISTLTEDTRQFSLDSTQLPLQLRIGELDLIVMDKLGAGSYGIAYNTFLRSNHKDPLVLKLYSVEESESLQNEVYILSKLDRLVYYVHNPPILVYKKIQGETLWGAIENNNISEIYMEEYKKLSRDFYKKTGWIHNDIRPLNVIVDDTSKELLLIDFGWSFKPNEQELEAVLAYDQEYALREYTYTILYIKMRNAYGKSNPKDSSIEDIEEFINYLFQHKERLEEIELSIKRYYRILYKLKSLDQFKYGPYLVLNLQNQLSDLSEGKILEFAFSLDPDTFDLLDFTYGYLYQRRQLGLD